MGGGRKLGMGKSEGGAVSALSPDTPPPSGSPIPSPHHPLRPTLSPRDSQKGLRDALVQAFKVP